jgi:DNA-binding NarL/FixJ family response regulator
VGKRVVEKAKVLIVDDHEIFCESLALLLSMKQEVEVVGVANSGKEAIKKVDALKPSIVLMDIEMKDLDGIETMRRIREKYADINFIMLTMHSDEEYILEALEAGAKGYILKDFSSSQIFEAIKSVGHGKIYYDPDSSYKVIESLHNKCQRKRRLKEDEHILSQREIEVLKFIAEGCSNKEISSKLFVSPHTIRNHITNIFDKLNCHSRTKAVIEAQRKNLI